MGEKQAGTGRRGFLKTVAAAGGLAQAGRAAESAPEAAAKPAAAAGSAQKAKIQYPRVFSGRHLSMISFPLGGIGAGSIGLGGRGQLRDWEIFSRPDKGRCPSYTFAALWVRRGKEKPVARVLEGRLEPPFEGPHGLSPAKVPGLLRLAEARFTGEYPLAKIDFRDSALPVSVTLEAFSPFIPLDADDSGLPVAVLRYRVKNPGKQKVVASIAFSLDNPIDAKGSAAVFRGGSTQRVNDVRKGAALEGLLMSNPGMAADQPENGTFALAVMNVPGGRTTQLRGWAKEKKWWATPLHFWDQFSVDGELPQEESERRVVGSVCLKQEIAPGAEARFTFVLAWRFPLRTPEWCGWQSSKGDEKVNLGNYHATRFHDAWEAAEYTAKNLESLEKRTRQFADTIRKTTVPGSVKDAATANLSTLVTQTVFRTADGEFHGFEGSDTERGCCFGNCTHVWNYEPATQHLFPALSRSFRKAAFGHSEAEDGSMVHRQVLPDGKERFDYAAADGQMGQIVKAYLDWRLSGDLEWLRGIWPRVRKGIEFAWSPGGWDADRDGVMENIQHNTYDIEFYGPNPQCGTWYLAALRACEEMARAVQDSEIERECRRLFDHGSRWIDENLFNGEYYIQQVRSIDKSKVAPITISPLGSDRGDKPDFQLSGGCLLDQLIGQYYADIAGLGGLLDAGKVRKTLQSIYKYNYKRNMLGHESVQRIYALNDEPGLVVCDYTKAKRPRLPFSFFDEVWTGLEYPAAAQMIYAGMVSEGLECIENVRQRYDGERRDPWNEMECGYHYARAMSAWSGLLALSGFHYHGAGKSVSAAPKIHPENFASFWSTATGWGMFHQEAREGGLQFKLAVTAGALPCKSVTLVAAAKAAGKSSARIGSRSLRHSVRRDGRNTVVTLDEEMSLNPGEELVILL